jgi:transcriptional regulator with XRE-family HTH domain
MIPMKILIREKREQQGLGLRQLAQKSGVSKTHLSRIENGESDPTLGIICKIARALKEKPCNLFVCDDPWWNE